jgi:hypothetical protein
LFKTALSKIADVGGTVGELRLSRGFPLRKNNPEDAGTLCGGFANNDASAVWFCNEPTDVCCFAASSESAAMDMVGTPATKRSSKRRKKRGLAKVITEPPCYAAL